MNQLKETIREVFHYLKQYKSRTAMTMFGIVWGTMTVILLLSFGVGVQKSMSKNMHGMGEGIAIMWPGRTSLPFEGYGRGRSIRFRADDTELLRQEIPELHSISPEYSTYGINIRHGDKVNKTSVSGIIPEYGPMRNVIPREGGRWLNDMDLKDRRRVAFIGYKLRDLLYGEDADVVGEYVMVGDVPFRIIGVLIKKTQPSSYGTRDQDKIFIPSTTFESVFGAQYLDNIIFKVRDARQTEYVTQRIFEVLGKKNKFDPEDNEALYIWDTTEMDKFIFYFNLGFKIFLGAIGAITLLVGGIGLANIMYVVVQERTREIGIKRSIGAKKHHIMGQFIVETFIIIGISALMGFTMAYGLIKLIGLMPIEEFVGHPELSGSVAIISIAILGAIGFFAGYFPARRAARMNVVDCFR